MEIRVGVSVRVPIEEKSQIAQARRLGVEMADSIGCDEVKAGQVAIVITEVCTNILKYAESGEVLLRVAEDESTSVPLLEILAIDKGPGMRNLAECMTDGYSTSSSPGQGMGAIRRLSSESDFYSAPGEGTLVLARWWVEAPRPGNRLRAGAVNLPKRGEEVCGDSWGIEQKGDVTVVLVADGLGHGYEAAAASREAVRMLRDHADETAQALVQRCHQALRSTRGAAIAAARIDRGSGLVTFCGVGNVMAQIYDGAQFQQHLVSVNGTAGHQTPRLREFSCPWPKDGMILLCSDGLSTSTSLRATPALALRDSSLIAGALYRDFVRGNDDATAVVAKAA